MLFLPYYSYTSLSFHILVFYIDFSSFFFAVVNVQIAFATQTVASRRSKRQLK